MSTVIQLNDFKRERKPMQRLAGESADIVIFHGVRVERLTDDMIAASAAGNGRRIPSLRNEATAQELE